ncbi:MAG: hypothetical protein K0R58_4286, partial [Ramlibacter sp.]|nr:hypothetical protein [Ramlibacter sp.]
DSFNVATHVGDDAAHVAANRARLRELLGLAAEPAWLNQVHSATVINLDSGVPASPPTADAAITSRAGVACVVMVADCLPVLLTTHDGSRIGAAHAGWRGLASGVIEQAVRALGKPGRELRAWLGPCISREYFEVGGRSASDKWESRTSPVAARARSLTAKSSTRIEETGREEGSRR